ncbi:MULTISPECIES: magnesium transporter CorA family protein [Paenibacillus]|uniref:magnesium transporter CorA family protein n=1 Tax=Paenibacillus TaxID=44249 RepID=UPI001F3C2902|nr:magnesium transporter CorA family protein [Paenibacillus sp. JJ-223]CAH1221165.1 Magnesium transport protein CorA [Paenibacillus sp. JJ-223]
MNKEKAKPEFRRDRQFFSNNWEWWDWVATDEDGLRDALDDLIEIYPEMQHWLRKIPEVKSNYLSVRFMNGTVPVIFGSLLYAVKNERASERQEYQMYFYMDRGRLFTLNLDDNTRGIMCTGERAAMLQQAKDAREGMFILFRAILHYYHVGMDQFEMNLRGLERKMESRNNRTLMDQILAARFELLYWSNHFIPFAELIAASREAFLEELEESRFFRQLAYRVERMDGLFKHYEKEIDTLISIDNAASGIRGNEIMKTLTIVTSVCTPATVAGAVWGMNFENLPFIDKTWGVVLIIALILASMAGMYGWMMMRGWTGDLLKGESSRPTAEDTDKRR